MESSRSATSLIQQLRRQIRRLETASRRPDNQSVSSGCPVIDRLLPEQGFARGTLVEWFSGVAGSGTGTLSLLAARAACEDGGALVVADPARRFYPPAAAAWGIHLASTIVLQSSSKQQLYWAVHQALQCPSVAAVWGWFEGIGERWFRRFQLAAEESGCIGLFLRDQHWRRQPSWSEIQLLVEPFSKAPMVNDARTFHVQAPLSKEPPSMSDGRWGSGHSFSFDHSAAVRHLRVQLLRSRSGCSGIANLEINLITGLVSEARRYDEAYSLSLAAQLAHPKTRRRSARA